ncbi:hypothetical protein FH972_017143 [Carpinus fangiana]|uniref:GPI-anchored protein LLG1-like domain-containing protein n=1 Tax=Carpinus fangiana TaxID=176857 RepID=A0A5N6RLJ4_9ROSI|nr:hypothetical protein FH972_017143 [Carpinus fangiana]
MGFEISPGLSSTAKTTIETNSCCFSLRPSLTARQTTTLRPTPTANVDFVSKNYTILTSRCKGPRFPPLACCNALKDFTCTYADASNDMTADCTAIMFSYMDLYGGYPPGLLANKCSEGIESLVLIVPM